MTLFNKKIKIKFLGLLRDASQSSPSLNSQDIPYPLFTLNLNK